MAARKRCTKCLKRRSLTQFDRFRYSPDGYAYKCKVCARKWYRRRRTLIAKKAAARRFGVTVGFLEALLRRQKGMCGCCGKVKISFGTGQGGLHTDHCHRSGRVRGLLCAGCNLVLGHAREDPAVLRAALRYLRK